MRFYVAGKWEDRENVRVIQNALVEMGHEISCDWTWHEKEDPGYPHQYSIDDIQGVKDAHFYIGLFEGDFNYKGALVELGAALALEKPCYIIGRGIDGCMFVNHPLVIRCETISDFLSEIG